MSEIQLDPPKVVSIASRPQSKPGNWSTSYCGFCGGTGARLGKQKETGHIYAFNCDCRVGELKRRPTWPNWSQRTSAEYDHWSPR